ncbi:MAG: hypothetical protein ABL966_15855, partial [Acidimicrobiales bacterium]
VFAHNTLGPSMVVRRADITDDDVAALAGPIRSVSAAAIDRWLPHAVTTWGTAEDLRALVPRVFELLTAGLLDTAPEVVFAKLRLADLSGWPIDEVGALDDIVGSLWLASLTQHPSPTGLSASRLLTALAELGRDLSPHLDDWLLLLASGTPGAAPARAHLRDLVQRVEALRALGLGVPALFWSPHPEEAARLELWLDSPVTTGRQEADADRPSP